MSETCRFRLAVLAVVPLLPLVGCSKSTGDQGVIVHVRVVENGQPMKFLPNEEISFGLSQEVPAGEKGVGVSGQLKPEDASALLSRPGKTGVPPGRYRVSMSGQIGYGGTPDRFEKIFDAKKPPLIVEVGPDEGQIYTVDIGKWTVTKS